MNYLSHVKKRKRYTWQKIAIIVAVCFIFGFLVKSLIVRSIVFSSNAIGSSLYSFLPQGFKSNMELAIENNDLKNKVQTLSAENADRKALATENADLKFRFGRSDNKKIVYATVIQKPPISPYDTFILDAGTETGIIQNNIVVFGSLAVGVIVEVGNGYAKAELFSSPGKTFQAMLGSDNIQIEAKGVGNGSFEALVPLGTEVLPGDTLVLPAISLKVFGIVQKVEDLQEEGFKKIFFALPVNPNQIGAVGIMLSK